VLLTVLMLTAVGLGTAIYVLEPEAFEKQTQVAIRQAPVAEKVSQPEATVVEVIEEEDDRTLEEGELSSLPVSGHVSLARYDESVEFPIPLYLGATKGCVHASVALALAEGQVLKLTLESDCPINWDENSSWENPRSEIGVIFAEMRSYIEGEGWWSISSMAKEVKQVSSSNGGRQFEIVLTPAGIAGFSAGTITVSLPPGTGIYKLLALNLDPNNSHYLRYSISSTEPPPQVVGETAEPARYFEILECPDEAYIGDYITVIARSNIHLLDDQAIGPYSLEGVQVRRDGSQKTFIPSEIGWPDSENIIRWYVEIPPDYLEPGVAILYFSVVSSYDPSSGSMGGYNTDVIRRFILKASHAPPS